MKVHDDCVVTVEYTIRNEKGSVVESSRNSGLLTFVQGKSEVPLGLEKAVDDAESGSRIRVRIGPADGYGHRDPKLIRSVNKIAFRQAGEPRKGMVFRALVDGRERVCRVVSRRGDTVRYDANHPLADQTLDFDIRIVEIEAPE